jgi:hypothetical protein
MYKVLNALRVGRRPVPDCVYVGCRSKWANLRSCGLRVVLFVRMLGRRRHVTREMMAGLRMTGERQSDCGALGCVTQGGGIARPELQAQRPARLGQGHNPEQAFPKLAASQTHEINCRNLK